MGLRIEVIEEKLQRAYKQKREAHSSLASLFKASWKLPTNVETSNSELHADTYISIPIHPLCLSCGYTIG